MGGEVMATYKTFRVHLGELVPSELVYWKYDIIESLWVDRRTWCMAAVCPPWVLMNTRQRIVNLNERQRGTALYSESYAAGFTQQMFVAAHWTLYVVIIVLCLLDFAEDGCLQLALTLYLFWLALCVGNRQMIKQFYGIDSSNLVFDLLSWTFCWCWAGVQVYGSTDAPIAPAEDEVEMMVPQAEAEEYVQ